MARYRVGLIGCGSIGRAHAYGRTNNERVELVAIADITASARDDFGEEFGVAENQRYTNFREMLEKEKPDIVSVCRCA
jgi:predicted dehydrogenase